MTIRRPSYKRVFRKHDDAEERAELAATIWVETVAHLDESGLKTKARMRLVDQYVRALVEYEYLYPVAMAEGPTLTSDSGGQYANMKWSAIGKLSESISKWADSLLITPKAADGKAIKPKSKKKKDAGAEFGV